MKVFVKTGSKKGPLVVSGDDELMVYLREKPHDGEANESLVKILAKHFGVAKSCVVIQRGTKSHKKVVKIL